MTEFTPWSSLLGGAMIGLAAVLFLAYEGRIAGISGIASRLFTPSTDDAWLSRLGFIGGMVAAPMVVYLLTGVVAEHVVSDNLPMMAVAGLLVGFGTVLGNGCTSGHGVCGMARLSVRSIVATCVFMVAAIATVYVTRHVIGA
ncbi:MAG: YeeE/YedE family protein [Mesorhizobium sp.]